MPLVIQKYGGTSVSDLACIQAVAERVYRTRRSGTHVAVVVSAMAGVTDELLRLARAITPKPEARELDQLLATGEMVSSALVAMALQTRGCPAQSFTGQQAGILTDHSHTAGQIQRIEPTRLRRALALNVIPVVAGFQGENAAQDITTLGRGGSDLTAVALAAALRAERCEIYTDVDGVYSEDPRTTPDAERLACLSYDEMLEMTLLGAKVLQVQSVVFAKKHDVPIVVKSSFSEGPGTLITNALQASVAALSWSNSIT